ncbi:hypothetical protein SORBI_3002G308600, partial [Sorghum bicolor]
MIHPLYPPIPPPPSTAAPGAAGRARPPSPSPRHRGERGAHPRTVRTLPHVSPLPPGGPACHPPSPGAALPYSTQRRRRRIGLADASAPPRGLRRCYSRAIRRCVRCSGIDSAARG